MFPNTEIRQRIRGDRIQGSFNAQHEMITQTFTLFLIPRLGKSDITSRFINPDYSRRA